MLLIKVFRNLRLLDYWSPNKKIHIIFLELFWRLNFSCHFFSKTLRLIFWMQNLQNLRTTIDFWCDWPKRTFWKNDAWCTVNIKFNFRKKQQAFVVQAAPQRSLSLRFRWECLSKLTFEHRAPHHAICDRSCCMRMIDAMTIVSEQHKCHHKSLRYVYFFSVPLLKKLRQGTARESTSECGFISSLSSLCNNMLITIMRRKN